MKCVCGLYVCVECMLCLASVGMCQLTTTNVTFASTPHIPLQINTPSHLTRLTPSSSHSYTCFIAMCFMHCTLFSLLRLVYIINSNNNSNKNNIASSAQAQHLTYPRLFLLLMKKVVPLIIICHCIRMCAAIEIQLRISVNVCMNVCMCPTAAAGAGEHSRRRRAEERKSGGERVSASKRTGERTG